MTDTSIRILVVDDDVDACENLQDILTDFGCEVATANDGESALQILQQAPYDVALLDLKMPGMDGLTLYRKIKQLRAETVAIVVSAHAGSETADAALEAGAWRVLPKPVDFSALLPLVSEAAEQPLVLIVDDDHALCENLWELMRERGFRVGLAHDEEEAAGRLQETAHELVLVDMQLPKGDGQRVFQLVRRANPEARVLLITGHRDEFEDVVQRVLREGADAICYKPFDVGHLLQTVQRLSKTGGAER